MIDRRRLPGFIALVTLVPVTAAVALGMMWFAADVQRRVNEFYNTSANEVIPNEVYREWDILQSQGYAIGQLSTPMLTVTLFAVFAALAVLARRWDVTRGRALAVEHGAVHGPDQADAADAVEAAPAS